MDENSNQPDGDQSRRKYVFVGGSPRSGTSLLGRNIARMEDCTGLKNTGVFEDEGQFLQDVYPTASAYGGSSRCGFDPQMHRTETSDLLAPEKVARLRATWHSYWDNSKSIFVEKTPENFLMTRFLQAAFPNSYFVVIMWSDVLPFGRSRRLYAALCGAHQVVLKADGQKTSARICPNQDQASSPACIGQ
jgi:Sulfotransferase family